MEGERCRMTVKSRSVSGVGQKLKEILVVLDETGKM
jgi:hypothetical protein